jgi:hypothetical protein
VDGVVGLLEGTDGMGSETGGLGGGVDEEGGWWVGGC